MDQSIITEYINTILNTDENHDKNHIFEEKNKPLSLKVNNNVYDFEDRFINNNIFSEHQDDNGYVVSGDYLDDIKKYDETEKKEIVDKYFDEKIENFDYYVIPPEILELVELQNDYNIIVNSIINMSYEINKNKAVHDLFYKIKGNEPILNLYILIDYVIINLSKVNIIDFLNNKKIINLTDKKNKIIKNYNKKFANKKKIFSKILKSNIYRGGSENKILNDKFIKKLTETYLFDNKQIYSNKFINLDATIYQEYVKINNNYDLDDDKDYLPLIHKNIDIKESEKAKEMFEKNVLNDEKMHYLNKYLEIEEEQIDKQTIDSKLKEVFNMVGDNIINWKFDAKDPYIEEYNKIIDVINDLKILLSTFELKNDILYLQSISEYNNNNKYPLKIDIIIDFIKENIKILRNTNKSDSEFIEIVNTFNSIFDNK